MKGCQWWLGFLDFLEVTFFEEKNTQVAWFFHVVSMVFILTLPRRPVPWAKAASP